MLQGFRLFSWRGIPALAALLPITAFCQLPEVKDAERNGSSGRASSGNSAIQVPPINLPKNENHLRKAFLTRQTKWMEAQLFTDFPRRNAAAPWLKEATAILREAAPYLSGEIHEEPYTKTILHPSDDLIRRAKAVSSAGCDDPLFNFISAFLMGFERTPTEEIVTLAERRHADLVAGNDSPHLKLLAASWVWGARNNKGNPTRNEEKSKVWEKDMPRLLSAALNAAATPEASLAFYQYAMPGKIAFVFTFLRTRPEGIPILKESKAAQWMKDTMLGELAVTAAWDSRGGGYANTVTEDGWRGFEEGLANANRHLTAAWKANPDAPYAAQRMIDVVMGGGGTDGLDERAWFDRATAACFDFEPAYGSIRTAYLPRWGGSLEMLFAFGKACADTRRYDTSVPEEFPLIVREIASETNHHRLAYLRPEVAAKILEVEKGAEPYLKNDNQREFESSFAARSLYLAGDYASAARYFSRMKAPLGSEGEMKLNYYGVRPFEFHGRLALVDDPAAATAFDRAEELFTSQSSRAAARDDYAALAKLPSVIAKPEALALIQERLAAIAVEERFASGDWVKLSVEEGKLLWITEEGPPWITTSDGGLLVRNKADRTASRAALDVRVGLDFEVRARLDNSPDLAFSQFGCMVAMRPGFQEFGTVACGNVSNGAKNAGAAFVKFAWLSNQAPAPVTLKPNSRVLIRSKSGEVTLSVDDKQIATWLLDSVFDQRDPNRNPGRNDHLFGFGYNGFPKGDSRLTDIEFRKLPAKP